MAKGDNTLMTLIFIALLVIFGVYANTLIGKSSTKVDFDFTQVAFNNNGSSLNSVNNGVSFDSATNDFVVNNLSFANNVQNKVIDFANLTNVEIQFKASLNQPLNNNDTLNLLLSFNPSLNQTSLSGDGLSINFNALANETHYVNYNGVNWVYTNELLNNNSFSMTLRANLVDDYTFLSLDSINTGFVYESLRTEFVNGLGLQDFSLGVNGLLNNANTTLSIDELSLQYN